MIIQEGNHQADRKEQAARPTIEVGQSLGAKEVTQSLERQDQQFRVAIAQISTTPGRIPENIKKIIASIEEAKAGGAELVVFPELTVPGYAAMDLLFNETFILKNIQALQEIRKATQGITAIVGFVDWEQGKRRPGGRPLLHNSAAIIRDGEIVSVQDKTLHPNYDVFFEDRYFGAARAGAAVNVGGRLLGTEICEDLWNEDYGQNPTAKLAAEDPDVIINLSASPFHLGKLPTRLGLIQAASKAHHVPFIYANLVGCFDGFEGELVFDGRSIVMGPDGQIISMAKGFSEDLSFVDIFDRKRIAVPEIEEVSELHAALVLGIREYFNRRGYFSKAIIGISGGIDSALVAALATEALGPDRVLGITMPSRFSSKDTFSDAHAVCDNLGVELRVVPIEAEIAATQQTLRADPEFASSAEDVADENIQARLRMLNLMYYANKVHGLVLNTGNRTELALNNMTIYGDMVGGFSVLGDVDKDRVYALARYINAKSERPLIPASTIERPPSGELKPNQIDADVMGAPPEILAPMVREIVEQDLSFTEAKKRFSEKFPEPLIRRCFERLDHSEWKRRQGSPAIRVSPHTFGNGRKVPMNHGFID